MPPVSWTIFWCSLTSWLGHARNLPNRPILITHFSTSHTPDYIGLLSGTLIRVPSIFFSACSKVSGKIFVEVVKGAGLQSILGSPSTPSRFFLHVGGEVHIHNVGELVSISLVVTFPQRVGFEGLGVPALHSCAVKWW